ncbi:MAG: ATP-dependent DNA ligase [Gemmataceae bacterium]|nr:ATP-dependent DNA ligase [Gemmataceae bacterium]
MKLFAELYKALDATTKTKEKLRALVLYFQHAPSEDAAWAIYFLVGRRPRLALSWPKLRAWACRAAAIPDWLFDECYHAVGDLAETIALVLPAQRSADVEPLHHWIGARLLPLARLDDAGQRDVLVQAWAALDSTERLVWNKLITGAFRVGVSQQLVTRALAEVANLPADVVAHRLMGHWQPTAAFYQALTAPETTATALSRPFPFFLAHPLEDPVESLGDVASWQAEWKWDGIRAQFIRRQGQVFLWSRGEELVTERFPEIAETALWLPDGTVLDGEILPWKDGQVLPFAQLQRRIGRKNLGARMLAAVPVVFLAFDILERSGEDVRARPLHERRAWLEELIQGAHLDRLILAPIVSAPLAPEGEGWKELARLREDSRARGVEGLMLKRLDSAYGVGRQRGAWLKWKINPFTMDAVLIYAQRGSGKRASIYTDYTFGVWDEGKLVPVAKAYSGLTDEEIRAVDRFVRHNSLEKFGPVRAVPPVHVFELAFEGIQFSTRHKSGVAVRFPRIARWRKDKKPEEADTLKTLRGLIPEGSKGERGSSASSGSRIEEQGQELY